MPMTASILVSMITDESRKRISVVHEKLKLKQQKLSAKGLKTGSAIKRGWHHYKLNLIQCLTLSVLSSLFVMNLSGCTKERQVVRIDDEPDYIETRVVVRVPDALVEIHYIPETYEGMTYAELEALAIMLASSLMSCNADKTAISEIAGAPVEPAEEFSGAGLGIGDRLAAGVPAGAAGAGSAGAGAAGLGWACIAGSQKD